MPCLNSTPEVYICTDHFNMMPITLITLFIKLLILSLTGRQRIFIMWSTLNHVIRPVSDQQ